MHHISFSDTGYDTAILIKTKALIQANLQKHYVDHLDSDKVVAFSLEYDRAKPSAACMKEYIPQLLAALRQCGVTRILCADGEYFKKLTKQTKADPHIGYVLSCAWEGYEDMHVVYTINYQQLFYKPDLESKIELSLQVLNQHYSDSYKPIGSDVLRNVSYPESVSEIAKALTSLHQYPALTCDIEAFSLKHYDAGIGTISFSWNKHSGIAFLVDYKPHEPKIIAVWDKKDKKYKERTAFGEQIINHDVRALLKQFFLTYKGNMKYHNITFDAYVIIYQLFMEDMLDQQGLLYGLEVMLRDFDCTQIITYLATNSCAGNKLSLKEQSHEFAGNYAEDVKDIRLLPPKVLLKYNLVDTCATWYVYDKHWNTLVQDEQLPVYTDVMKPAVWDIIQMQLTGMCLDMQRVHEVEEQIQAISNQAVATLLHNKYVKKFVERMIEEEVIERNARYKKKVITAEEAKYEFNPNSGKSLIGLLYDDIGLPVIDLTDTKLPATGNKTLKKLMNHTDDPDVLEILQALVDFIAADKILSAFIGSFKEAPLAPDGCHYLFGSFKLGGTVSGRLSSSNPNLQQIPSGSTFAKLIKSCFIAPPGYVFLASDFNGLEDVINALLTKDPMKLKVLTDGYDGHSFRAYYYWKDKFPDINPDDPESVYQIKLNHDSIRSASKPVSFAMQYQGTWSTLVKNCGFEEDEAKAIEANYHDLYKVSMDWVNTRIEQASKDGYAVGAFGLRIRTPLLSQVILGNSKTPTEAQAEARTLGNAISGQSYGLLNTYSSIKFMRKVRNHENYRLLIRPCAHIHDAQYMYVKDDFHLIAWVNKHLMECMHWQDLPELHHEKVRIGSELDIQYPTWKDAFTIPNGADASQIQQICAVEAKKRRDP